MDDGGRITPGGQGRPAPPAPVHFTVVDTDRGPDQFMAACEVPAPWRSTSLVAEVTCCNCRASVAYIHALPSPRHAGGPQDALDRMEAGVLSQWVSWQARELLDHHPAVQALLAEFGHSATCMCPVCRQLAATRVLLAQIIKEM